MELKLASTQALHFQGTYTHFNYSPPTYPMCDPFRNVHVRLQALHYV